MSDGAPEKLAAEVALGVEEGHRDVAPELPAESRGCYEGTPLILKQNFQTQAAFDEEMRLLFGRGHQFVCLTSELANDRDFVCLDHAGCSIVVQNFKGELRAFVNVCSHRFNKIQTAERGNRPLTCSYHGWSYDQTGFPRGLPRREQFLTGDDASLCLTAYPVVTCGKFVFVKMADGPSLEEELGTFYKVLDDLSTHIGAEFHFGHIDHAANWKLLVENVLECYHCAVVHQDTFIPLGIGKLPLNEIAIDASHSSCHFPRIDERREHLRQRYLSHLKDRGLTHNSLYHIHIFPNLFISSPEGLSFYVGQALPISPSETRLRIRLFEPAVQLTDKQKLRQEPINAATVETSVALIEEDRVILENIQKAIRFSDKPGRVGDEEVRIKAFAHAYAQRMSAG